MRRTLTITSLAVVLLAAGSSARAQTFSRLLQDPFNGNDLAETFDHPLIENTGHINNAPRYVNPDASVFWYDSYGKVRFNRDDPDSPFVGYRSLTISTDTDGRVIKATMDEFDAAVGLHLGSFDGWNTGVMLGAGFSTTHPFVNASGVFGIGHLTAEHALNAQNQILLSVDYEGNANLLPDVPLPGFAWIHHEQNLDVLAGFPLSRLRWQPLPALQIGLQYNVPFSANADAEYRLARHYGLYLDGANFFQGFVPASGDITTRQFMQMRRVEAGLRIIYDPLVDASIGVGYAFDQEFSRGFDVRDLTPIGHISNEPYISLVLRGTF